MTKGYIKFILVIITLCTVSSCREKPIIIDSEEKRIFLETEATGLYIKGKPTIIYSESDCQMTYNKKRRQFRIQTDSQNNYFNVILESVPKTKGVNIITKLDYRINGEEKSLIMLFECSNISEENYWLWDGDTKTGVIIKKKG